MEKKLCNAAYQIMITDLQSVLSQRFRSSFKVLDFMQNMAGSKTGSEDAEVPNIQQTNKILPWAVFIPTLVIVLISITSLVFPALLVRASSPFHSDVLGTEVIDPFTPGFLAAPLIGINLLVLGIGVAYYKGMKVRDLIKKIASFEISKNQAIIGIIIILVIFCAVTAGTLAKEETWEDYASVKKRLTTWSTSDFTHSFEPHVKYLLLSASTHIFGNIRVIPFITTFPYCCWYTFSLQISRKRNLQELYQWHWYCRAIFLFHIVLQQATTTRG